MLKYIINLPSYLLRKYRARKISYSLSTIDLLITHIFKNKKKGFFIDIGCHHPFKANNTFLLYKSGWSGINIDLNKISIDLFNVARSRDINICAAISNKEGTIEYYLPNNNPLSSEITIDKNFSKVLTDIHGNEYQTLKTKSITWQSIEKQYSSLLESVDILKIDIEGSDLKVIKTIDLNKLNPKLLMIEASTIDVSERDKIIYYLKLQNYKILYDNKVNVIFSK
jgi:FkbM family methyltransferase